MTYKFVRVRKLLQAISFSLIFSCGVNAPVTTVVPSTTESTTDSINELLSQAAFFSGNQAFVLKLEAISELIEYGLFERAKEEIGKINNSDSFELEARLNFLLFNAQIAAAEKLANGTASNATKGNSNILKSSWATGLSLMILSLIHI